MKRCSTAFIAGATLGLALGGASVAWAAWQPIPGGSSYLMPGRNTEIICASTAGIPRHNTLMRVMGPSLGVGALATRYSVIVICPP